MPLYPGFCPKKEYFKYILFPVKIKERLQPAGITLSYQQSLPFPACGVLLYVLLTPAYAEMNAAAARRINALLQWDAGDWNGYTCKPSFFIQKRESLGYEDNAAIVEKELDYTLESRW